MPEALIIEDDANTLSALAEWVRRQEFTVHCAENLKEARQHLRRRVPRVILTDLMLPDGRGTDLLPLVRSNPDSDLILFTGHGSVDSVVEALRMGAYDYLAKPVDHNRLKLLLDSVMRTRKVKKPDSLLRSDLRQLGRFGPLIGTSPPMRRVYDLIERVAPTEATVFLTGESGTGKELAARAVHQLSRRHEQPFEALNCGAMAPGLIESYLFGHERGAFTGAVKQQVGYFERASGGTLLLDEITEMPLELQVKLLRVLENRTIQRIGSGEEHPVDVRLVSATNRDPQEAVEAGVLREDLFYRLNVFPIEMPPLRKRLSDVEILALSMLVELNQQTLQVKQISRNALEQLANYNWPGNVRELRNVIRRSFILADTEIRREHLPAEVQNGTAIRGDKLMLRVGMSVADAERQLVLATLDQYAGDKRRSAEVLGMSLKTLYNRLVNYASNEQSASSAASGREDLAKERS